LPVALLNLLGLSVYFMNNSYDVHEKYKLLGC